MRTPNLRLLLLFALVVTPVQAQRPPSAGSRSADAITAEQLKAYLHFIASDEMEGRNTPSRGLDTTAKFLALNLSRWGLKPAGDDGTFFQKIALRRSRTDLAGCSAAIGSRTYASPADFKPAAEGFRGNPVGGIAEGVAVYAGYGWVVKAKNIDPYAGADVKDKIVVINATSGQLPPGISFQDRQGKQGEDWDSPAEYARRHGAKGLVRIPTFAAIANWQQPDPSLQRESIVVEKFSPEDGALPSITLSAAMVQELFRGEKQSAEQVFAAGVNGAPGPAFELSKTVKLTVALKTEKVPTQNVVAVLEGSDATLKSEYVAFGAHYDHVGVSAAGTGDTIFNGADDDGSGTTALLAMAEAASHSPRPKRSLLFVWHCGEEKGLWGSRYFTENPTLPLDRVVAQFNIDMIGRTKAEGDTNPRNANLAGPDQVYVIGSKMMSTELGLLSESVNAGYLNLKLDYRYDDPKDPNRFFYRSDHINYARKGIPIIFYFTGVHEDYHRVSDHAEKIDYQKLERVTRTIYTTARAVADLPTRPKVDKPLAPEVAGGRR